MAGATSPKFTLRFEHQQTHELLRIVADHFGTSMNALAEDMIARELQAIGLTIEQDLYGTLDLLQRYRAEDIEAGLSGICAGGGRAGRSAAGANGSPTRRGRRPWSGRGVLLVDGGRLERRAAR